jgi:hypothetical protein
MKSEARLHCGRLDAFQHQHKPQSDSRTFDIAAVSSCFDISGHRAPRRPSTAISWQVSHGAEGEGAAPEDKAVE